MRNYLLQYPYVVVCHANLANITTKCIFTIFTVNSFFNIQGRRGLPGRDGPPGYNGEKVKRLNSGIYQIISRYKSEGNGSNPRNFKFTLNYAGERFVEASFVKSSQYVTEITLI